ncbi:Lrp/AsnC family transcriptional regulator [Shewanella acanthi]|uniref:Lrp/AsnC family transcriptional regulator n=1 Tax=Shewanella acanthi TaxID=2864212 RepID=UPI001C659E7C|nr:Lrp/AsnC family transcriptional regulator [Shewanella acanthi]QYJ80274.1 Lrp/AsnC family transcriptional regulator [Shewanella acanthi]
MKNTSLDKTDKAILKMLQQDCTLSVSEIAERVALTTTPCWKRIQRLEQQNIISKRVALLKPQNIGLDLVVVVMIKTSNHESTWLEKFAEHAASFDEVVEFYRLSGIYDYMLKVIVPDMSSFDVFYKKLVAKVNIAEVTSSFAMEQIKYTTALPIK